MNNIVCQIEHSILPGAEPFEYKHSDEVACLLLHGFTASPQALRGLGKKLQENGYSHYAPLLPGHGTKVEDLNKITWTQQEQFVEQALKKLIKQHEKIVLIGESSGATLALRMATKYPDLVAGVASVCGALKYPGERFLRTMVPFYKRIRPYPQKYRVADVKDRSAIKERVAYRSVPMHAFQQLIYYSRQVVRELPKIKTPLLILQTLNDHAISTKSAFLLYERTASEYKKILWYPKSYHILLIDHEKEKAFGDILNFVDQIASDQLEK